MSKVLVFGGEGLIGSRFTELNKGSLNITAPLASEVDFLKDRQLEEAIKNSDASTVINFAAYTNVDEAEKEVGNKDGVVYRLNVKSVGRIAEVCKETGKYLIHISTDYVFDGQQKDRPYSEDDKLNPLSWYGQTKYLGEQAVLEGGDKVSIVRFEVPFRSQFKDKKDIVRFFLDQLQQGQEITAISDQKITPLFIDDGALALKLMIEKETQGIFHVVCTNSTTPYDLARLVAEKFGLDQDLVKPIEFAEYDKTRAAKRPQFCWLDTKKFRQEFGENILHTVEESLEIFKKQFKKQVDSFDN